MSSMRICVFWPWGSVTPLTPTETSLWLGGQMEERVGPALLQSGHWLVLKHPVEGLHASSVQALPSSQLTGAYWHPVAGEHESVVHALPSSQLGGLAQLPSEPHTSSVQILPSSQSAGPAQPVSTTSPLSITTALRR